MLVQPLGQIVVEELLAPEQPGERLAHDRRSVRAVLDGWGVQVAVELIRLVQSIAEDRIEVAERLA